MAKTLIIYGSTTGNTEMVAEQIGDYLQEKGAEVTLRDVSNARVEELTAGWDCVLLGASTWGDEEIEFQEDFEPFYHNLDQAELKGLRVGVFGCGDSSFPHYCGAVDLLDQKMTELGAELLNEPLRIDGEPDASAADIRQWAAELSTTI
ncbi:flavodoxin [Desulfogranum mediterraneum]|uniref:flavodoxin n=1 Tax=Desulfogranum mediterraneum TaxID=160661 RepID=UPI000422499D|nr:flavodoxin [Desulfogranum mediterraneum]